MFAKITSFFRSEPRPVTPATPANNVLHIERIRQRHFFNAIERAVLRSDLTRNNIERVMHNAREIWRKHLDGVPGYSVQRECEQFALDYLDLRVKYQRNDNKPAPDRPWSPRPVGPRAA